MHRSPRAMGIGKGEQIGGFGMSNAKEEAATNERLGVHLLTEGATQALRLAVDAGVTVSGTERRGSAVASSAGEGGGDLVDGETAEGVARGAAGATRRRWPRSSTSSTRSQSECEAVVGWGSGSPPPPC